MNNQLQYELKEAFTRGYAMGAADAPSADAFKEFDRLFGTMGFCPMCKENITKNKDICDNCKPTMCREFGHKPVKNHFDEGPRYYCAICNIDLPEDYEP